MYGLNEIIEINNKAAEKELKEKKEKTDHQKMIENYLSNKRNGKSINDDKVIITINNNENYLIVMSEIDKVIHDVINELMSKQIIEVK